MVIKYFSALNKLDTSKKPFSNDSTNISNKTNNLPNADKLQHTNCDPSTSFDNISKSIKDSDFQMLLPEKSKIIPLNNAEPSCSNKDNLITPIKIEPNITSTIFSRGIYRKEEDSIIVIYSSDEEDNICKNDSKVENNINHPEYSIQCQRNELMSDDEDDIIYVEPSNIDSNNINVMKISSDSDNDSIKFPQIIEPFPMIPNVKRRKPKNLADNKNIIKTRMKTEKRINNKKKTDEIIVDQNKQFVQERRLRLQHLAKSKSNSLLPKNKLLNENPSMICNKNNTDYPSTMDKLQKITRISRSQQNDNKYFSSTSKPYLTSEVNKNDVLGTEKKVKFNLQKDKSRTDDQIALLNCNKINSLTNITQINNAHNFIYFDTLSKICKWNVLWLHVS